MEERLYFSSDGFCYAASLMCSRACFIDGALRLLPYLGVGMLWGSAKGALLKSGKRLRRGSEVCIS